MTNDCVAQTWYRFLRTIGSPIALCSPQVISKTPQFMQWVVSRADGVEAFHHPCLLQLPFIFLKAIKGIASQVDAFLGMKPACTLFAQPHYLFKNRLYKKNSHQLCFSFQFLHHIWHQNSSTHNVHKIIKKKKYTTHAQWLHSTGGYRYISSASTD